MRILDHVHISRHIHRIKCQCTILKIIACSTTISEYSPYV
nr:MAG TPA: hypothetical protein [Bacteriophage sp.]